MDIHQYDPDTGEFLRSATARLDPLASKAAGVPRYLVPANATSTAPPAALPGQASVWNKVQKTWDSVADHRGETWYGGADGRDTVTIDVLGDPATQGLIATEPPPPPPTAGDVRSEASRRLQALLGARDGAHLGVLISNGTREAVRLLRKGSANWTTTEAARAAGLEALDNGVEAIRAASNVLEALSPVPLDYAADPRWP